MTQSSISHWMDELILGFVCLLGWLVGWLDFCCFGFGLCFVLFLIIYLAKVFNFFLITFNTGFNSAKSSILTETVNLNYGKR